MISRALSLLIMICLLTMTFGSSRAYAISGGDAVLTVGGGALAGSILGVSTLPFYNTPSDHTQNIWVGAAVGAVVGVLVAAAVGFAETSENIDDAVDASRDLKLQPELSPALAQKNTDTVLAWSPVATLRF